MFILGTNFYLFNLQNHFCPPKTCSAPLKPPEPPPKTLPVSPPGDTASNLGSAVDELMRHQPTLKTDATTAIIKVTTRGHS